MREDASEKTYQTELFVMKKATLKVAQSIVRDFGELERLQVSRKGVCNFVTSSDIRAESRIINELQKSNLDYDILSEESGFLKTANHSEYTWVVDPIDGTNNFRRGIPYFCISIALVKKDIPVASVCLDPIRGDLFRAARNAGAYADNKNRIHVTSKTNLLESVVAIHSNNEKLFASLVSANAIVRRTGSISLDLAYLASGKFDAVIADNVRWWDIATGIVLVKEAGGVVEYEKSGDAYNIKATCSRRLLNAINSIQF